MLNLKKLEQQLDEALAKETKESLTNWLLEKRAKNKNYLSFLGDGSFGKENLFFNKNIEKISFISFLEEENSLCDNVSINIDAIPHLTTAA
ncbi:MAG: hypothetical protein ACPG5B_03565 [Chitinophagales bacterium]